MGPHDCACALNAANLMSLCASVCRSRHNCFGLPSRSYTPSLLLRQGSKMLESLCSLEHPEGGVTACSNLLIATIVLRCNGDLWDSAFRFASKTQSALKAATHSKLLVAHSSVLRRACAPWASHGQCHRIRQEIRDMQR